MAKLPLSKINQRVKAEGFIQVHFIKGYKYIDRAGELVNFFHGENKTPPSFSMSMSGLTIRKPRENVAEIKVSSTDFWAHFIAPDSLEVMEDFFRPNADAITKTLEIADVQRVGWRIFFVHEFGAKEERDAALKKFVPLENLEFGEVYFVSKIGDVSLNIRIRNVVKTEEDDDEQDEGNSVPGILIDVDFYKKFDEALPSAKLLVELESLKSAAKSADFLKLVNDILA